MKIKNPEIEIRDAAYLPLKIGGRPDKLIEGVIKITDTAPKNLQATNNPGMADTIRESNLLHSYYAINSVDGRSVAIPSSKVGYFRPFWNWLHGRQVYFFS